MDLNKVYNEDCLDTFLRMPDNAIDLVLTSPPYDHLRGYSGYSFNFEPIAVELNRILKIGGVIVWVVGDASINGSETGTSFSQALFFKSLGLRLHDTMIYRKKTYVPLNHNRYEQEFEFMFVFSKGRPKTFNPIRVPCKTKGNPTKGRSFYHSPEQDLPSDTHSTKPIGDTKVLGNVWDIYPVAGIKGHPAQFPEQLANDHIISWTNPGDIVYDPFMGSGTTAKMAKLNNRNYIGSEISFEYCKLCEVRLNDS